jgi:hypothetical protein
MVCVYLRPDLRGLINSDELKSILLNSAHLNMHLRDFVNHGFFREPSRADYGVEVHLHVPWDQN